MSDVVVTAAEKQLLFLQKMFPTFDRFLIVMMTALGYSTTQLQLDIGRYLENGPKDLMIQAQRGQAKSTITALFAIWYLIHHPKGSVLIVSAGGKQANEISTLIVKTIMNVDILTCLRPNQARNDRQSVEAFDINFDLRGVQKSPSVACTGITGNLQGKRATLLIADDVESMKNGRTAMMRELLMQNCRDFASIVQDAAGRIVYLGTPQTDSSIYNQLSAMGFALRIWPGRYPTDEQLGHYGACLAPSLMEALIEDPSLQTGGGLDGLQGQPTDAQLMPEESLQAKEMKQGPAFFQLQHMLSTKLADALRYPLKLVNMVVMRLGDLLPVSVVRGMSHDYIKDYQVGSLKVQLSAPQYVSQDVVKPTFRHMRIDPAGGGKNGDETAYAVSEQLNGTVYLRAAGGVPGGFEDKDLTRLAQIVARWAPDVLDIEKNFGFGAFTKVFMPYLDKAGWKGGINETFESTNKELRIIDTLEPMLGRGSLVIDETIVLDDWDSTQAHPMDKRQGYSLLQQIAKITRDSGCLVHDDRLDAVAGTCGYWIGQMNQDSTRREAEARAAILAEKMADPFNYRRYDRPGAQSSGLGSVIRRR
jgi:hypothetical protein